MPAIPRLPLKTCGVAVFAGVVCGVLRFPGISSRQGCSVDDASPMVVHSPNSDPKV